MKKSESKDIDNIETLEIKIRHLENQHKVVNQQYEKATEKYLKILDDVSKTNKQLQQEITERKQTEEKLKNYQLIVESAQDAIFFKDLKSRYIFANNKTAEAFGLPRGKIIGKNDYELIPNKVEASKNIEDDQLIITTGKAREITKHMTEADGREYWFQAIKVPMFDDKRNVIGLVGIARDITDIKKVEEALRESEERFRSLFESAPELIHILDKNGTILQINPAVALRSGYTEEEMLGRSIYEFFAPASHKIFVRKFPVLMEQDKHRAEVEFVCKDGKIIVTDCSCTVVHDKRGEFAYTVIFLLDITERKRAEDELKHSHEQLRSLTEHLHLAREEERTLVAREIHDELGQALTALKIDVSWIKRNLPKKIYPLHEKIKSITELIDKTIKTTKEISVELRPTMLDDFGLEAALEWYADEFQNRTEITCEIHINLKRLTLDQNRSIVIFRIFQESLTNVARHANATMVKVNIKKDKDNLILRIEDNGKGIAKKQISDSKSFGLIGMRERLILLKGNLKISGLKNKGTTIEATVPLERRSVSR